ncbi:hypothetical protein MOQ72_38360 [Saccharopolyspora sp. K220]|nr:hypothetical protein [Saccharopolyspora soli]MCI2423299.1 hypothetical protein [Saccharopolyspora soli]
MDPQEEKAARAEAEVRTEVPPVQTDSARQPAEDVDETDDVIALGYN